MEEIAEIQQKWLETIEGLLKCKTWYYERDIIKMILTYMFSQWQEEAKKRIISKSQRSLCTVSLFAVGDLEFRQIIEQRRHRAIGSIVASMELFQSVAAGRKSPSGWPEFLATQLKERCVH